LSLINIFIGYGKIFFLSLITFFYLLTPKFLMKNDTKDFVFLPKQGYDFSLSSLTEYSYMTEIGKRSKKRYTL
jgi:hypothetical protein